MIVEIGLDRMHHAFWRFLDPTHPRHEPEHRYRDAIRNYYVYLDEEIGELLERFDDDTTVLVVSDHGARPMLGAICVNEWLVEEGYLVLEERPPTAMADAVQRRQGRLEPDEGMGRGRLLLPAVPQRRRPRAAGHRRSGRVRAAARRAGRAARGAARPRRRADRHDRAPPEELWRDRQGIPPDLFVYFGDLGWRSNGSLGHGRHWTYDNDTGPDDANHDRNGICILSGPGVPTAGATT